LTLSRIQIVTVTVTAAAAADDDDDDDDNDSVSAFKRTVEQTDFSRFLCFPEFS